MARERSSLFRVGALTLTALVILAVGVLMLGEQSRLFSRKNDYTMKVRGVSGLNEGNPVQLNGVNVGRVERIVLPRDAGEQLLEVRFSVEAKYAERIRTDSRARIRTLGLLGDKYVDISSGSPDAPQIEAGGQIPTAEATDVDQLISSGEDLVDNVLAISVSMRNVLERVDEGEGFVGELLADKEGSRRLSDSLYETMDSIQAVTKSLEEGQGPVARLINDEDLGNQLVRAVDRLNSVLAEVDEGDGVVASLIHDEELATQVRTTLGELEQASVNLEKFTAPLDDGDGALVKLLNDEAYGDKLLEDLQRFVGNLEAVSEKLVSGDGTAAQLIEDPNVYHAIQDIIVGIDESRILRWLIRNRQKKGIEKRYEATVEALEASGETVEPLERP